MSTNDYNQEQNEDECSPMPPHSTKLSVISELNSIALQNQTHQINCNNVNRGIIIPNGITPPTEPPTFPHLSFHHNHHSHYYNQHLIDQQSQLRRKSTCSIADSIRSGKFIPNNNSLSDEVGIYKLNFILFPPFHLSIFLF